MADPPGDRDRLNSFAELFGRRWRSGAEQSIAWEDIEAQVTRDYGHLFEPLSPIERPQSRDPASIPDLPVDTANNNEQTSTTSDAPVSAVDDPPSPLRDPPDGIGSDDQTPSSLEQPPETPPSAQPLQQEGNLRTVEDVAGTENSTPTHSRAFDNAAEAIASGSTDTINASREANSEGVQPNDDDIRMNLDNSIENGDRTTGDGLLPARTTDVIPQIEEVGEQMLVDEQPEQSGRGGSQERGETNVNYAGIQEQPEAIDNAQNDSSDVRRAPYDPDVEMEDGPSNVVSQAPEKDSASDNNNTEANLADVMDISDPLVGDGQNADTDQTIPPADPAPSTSKYFRCTDCKFLRASSHLHRHFLLDGPCCDFCFGSSNDIALEKQYMWCINGDHEAAAPEFWPKGVNGAPSYRGTHFDNCKEHREIDDEHMGHNREDGHERGKKSTATIDLTLASDDDSSDETVVEDAVTSMQSGKRTVDAVTALAPVPRPTPAPTEETNTGNLQHHLPALSESSQQQQPEQTQRGDESIDTDMLERDNEEEIPTGGNINGTTGSDNNADPRAVDGDGDASMSSPDPEQQEAQPESEQAVGDGSTLLEPIQDRSNEQQTQDGDNLEGHTGQNMQLDSTPHEPATTYWDASQWESTRQSQGYVPNPDEIDLSEDLRQIDEEKEQQRLRTTANELTNAVEPEQQRDATPDTTSHDDVTMTDADAQIPPPQNPSNQEGQDTEPLSGMVTPEDRMETVSGEAGREENVQLLPSLSTMQIWSFIKDSVSNPNLKAKGTFKDEIFFNKTTTMIRPEVQDTSTKKSKGEKARKLDHAKSVICEMFEGLLPTAERLAETEHSSLTPSYTAMNVLLSGQQMQSPFTQDTFDGKLTVIDGLLNAQDKLNWEMNIAQSYFMDIIDEDTNTLGDSAHARSKARIGLAQKLLSKTNRGKPSNYVASTVLQYIREWEEMRRLRQGGFNAILIFTTTNVIRCYGRNEINHENLVFLDEVAKRVFKAYLFRARERLEGKFQGHGEMLPESDFPKAMWSSCLGRWRTPADAMRFCRKFGAPGPHNILLDNAALYDHGPAGYGSLNGFKHVVMTEREGRGGVVRYCVATAAKPMGTVFGICPHVMSVRSTESDVLEYPGKHIAGSDDCVSYDPCKAIGTLSFVEYVTDAKTANVKFVADKYCDSALPNLYSVRILVVAIKNIGFLEPLKVAAESTTESERLSGAVQTAYRQPDIGELLKREHHPNDFAYTVGEIGSVLLHTVAETEPRILEVWRDLCLTRDSNFVVRVPEEIDAIIRPILKEVRGQLVDYNDLSIVQKYQSNYEKTMEGVRKKLDVGQLRIYQAVTRLEPWQYAFLGMKALSLEARKGGAREDQGIQKILAGDITPSSDRRLVHLRPKPIGTLKGQGSFSAALSLLFCVDPLRETLCTTWKAAYWDGVLSWSPQLQLPGGGQEQFARLVKQFLDQLAMLFDRMDSGDESSEIDNAILGSLWNSFHGICSVYRPKNHHLVHDGGDVHEVYQAIHEIITDALRHALENYIPIPSTPPEYAISTRAQTEVQRSTDVAKCWASFSKVNENSFLYRHTFGVLSEEQYCSAQIRHVVGRQMVPFSQLAASSPLNDADGTTLLEAIKSSFRSPIEPVATGNDHCETCDKQPLKQLATETQIAKSPEYLLVQVCRWLKEGNTIRKLLGAVHLPEGLKIDLADICDDTNTSSKYDIIAAVRHHGDDCDSRENEVVTNVSYNGRFSYFTRHAAGVGSEAGFHAYPEHLYLVLLRRSDLVSEVAVNEDVEMSDV